MKLIYCLDMHSKDLRAGGETEQRLYLLDAWGESPFYSDRERAALLWAEAVTLLNQRDVQMKCTKRRANRSAAILRSPDWEVKLAGTSTRLKLNVGSWDIALVDISDVIDDPRSPVRGN